MIASHPSVTSLDSKSSSSSFKKKCDLLAFSNLVFFSVNLFVARGKVSVLLWPFANFAVSGDALEWVLCMNSWPPSRLSQGQSQTTVVRRSCTVESDNSHDSGALHQHLEWLGTGGCGFKVVGLSGRDVRLLLSITIFENALEQLIHSSAGFYLTPLWVGR